MGIDRIPPISGVPDSSLPDKRNRLPQKPVEKEREEVPPLPQPDKEGEEKEGLGKNIDKTV